MHCSIAPTCVARFLMLLCASSSFFYYHFEVSFFSFLTIVIDSLTRLFVNLRITIQNIEKSQKIYNRAGTGGKVCQGIGAPGKGGHIAIAAFTGMLLSWRYGAGVACSQIHPFATPQRVEGCRVDTGRHYPANRKILHPYSQLCTC